MLVKGWIRPSVSPYSNPILYTLKKTVKLHTYICFCILNANTKLEVFLYIVLMIFWTSWAKLNTLLV